MNPNLPNIGIDFGGTSIKLAVVKNGELITEIERIDTQAFDGPDALLDEIVREVKQFQEQFPAISAIGIGVPGTVDFEEGRTNNLTNVKGWTSVPLRDLMVEKTGLPTVVENDANCMAYAEWACGAAQPFQNAVCVTLGTGVGGGLILNGALYRGATYAAGEIGQMSIDYDGVEGPYGNTGCLERYIGNRQIAELGAKIYAEHGEEVPGELSPARLAELAGKGDHCAQETWQRVATYLGANLMSIIYLLNPEAIIIGGGVSYAGDLLFEPLQKRLRESLTPECFDALKVVHARYGNTAGIIGSAALATDLFCADC